MCGEMRRLRTALDNLGISWTDNSENGVCPMERTYFEVNGVIYSVIHGYGSYGGYSSVMQDSGLLEIMNHNDGDVEGYLTAEEVLSFANLTSTVRTCSFCGARLSVSDLTTHECPYCKSSIAKMKA